MVLLFELCTGRTLFAQDISNDNLVSTADRCRLATWRCIDDDTLDAVFADEDCSCDALQRGDAKHLVRWCLAGHPEERPSLPALLAHRFLHRFLSESGSQRATTPAPPCRRTAIRASVVTRRKSSGDSGRELDEEGDAEGAVESDAEGEGAAPPAPVTRSHTVADRSLVGLIGETFKVVTSSSARMRFHCFISHMQLEASGDCAALCAALGKLGLHAWRDMSQDDVTDAGMRQGVSDSDVLILFLTNSVLSRTFCLKEIAWAMELRKPILFVRETETRFYRWDIGRWRLDRCTRRHEMSSRAATTTSNAASGSAGGDAGDAESSGFTWCKSQPGFLQIEFARVPPSIVALVETAWADDAMLPFRRREFEVGALAREIVRRAGQASALLGGTATPSVWGVRCEP